jgi:hypothetical protein
LIDSLTIRRALASCNALHDRHAVRGVCVGLGLARFGLTLGIAVAMLSTRVTPVGETALEGQVGCALLDAGCLFGGGLLLVKCVGMNAFFVGVVLLCCSAGWLSVGCVACCLCDLTWAFLFDPSPKRQHHNIFDYKTIGAFCKSSPKMRLNSNLLLYIIIYCKCRMIHMS